MQATSALPAYQPPALAWPAVAGERQQIVWWIVFVGFAYAIAVAYAVYCTHTGGHPDIDLTWKGFKVECRS